MRVVIRGFGWLCVMLAVLLVAAGLSALPSGGLMFALPYVFPLPGALLAVVGWLLLKLGRSPPDAARETSAN